MKILFSAETLYPIWGGSDRSAITLLNELAKKHDVHAIYMGDSFDAKFQIHPQEKRFYKGQWMRCFRLYGWWEKVLEEKIKEIKPDVIITQDLFVPPSIKVAKKHGIKVYTFIRNTMHLSINGFMPMTLNYYSQYPFFLYVKNQFKKYLKDSNIIVVNSEALKKITDENYGTNCLVIRPFVKKEDYTVDSSKEYLIMINPDVHKGYKIFREIARKCPERKFLVVGKDIKEDIPNIKVVPWVDDMHQIYSVAKAALIPSFWFEPCGRIQIEAAMSLIPSIVSNSGGLPETVPKDLVVNNLFDIDEWVSKINLIETKDYSNELKKFREEFCFEKQIAKVKNLF